MPKAVFCIHALSLYMFKLGSAPQIEDLMGRVEFSRDEISVMEAELNRFVNKTVSGHMTNSS